MQFIFEASRLETFKSWPFNHRAKCNREKMAEAGFYWNGTENEKDLVTCFVCELSLEDWKGTDDPWTEHRKHKPECRFIYYRKKEKDLTVRQFIDIFGAVLRDSVWTTAERIKQEVRNEFETEISSWISEDPKSILECTISN